MKDLNPEKLVISRLLTLNSAERREVKKTPVDERLFHTYTREFMYINEFVEKYGSFPGRSAFKKRFPEFRPLRLRESARYYIDRLIDRENEIQCTRMIDRAGKLARDGKMPDAIAYMRKTLETSMVQPSDLGGTEWTKPPKGRYEEAVSERARLLREGKCYLTPYPALNQVMIGLRPENLVTLTGRLALGKTWMLLYFALEMARQGARVLVASLEMSEDEFADRLDAIDAKLNWHRFQRGTLKRIQRIRYRKALEARKRMKGTILVLGDSQIGFQPVDSLVRQIDVFRPDVVVVDGVAQYDAGGRVRDEVQKMLYVSRLMKRIAKSRKVVVLQSAQQNRTGEGKKEGGGIGGISWTDALACDADVVLEIVAPEGRQSTFRKLKIIKGRNVGYKDIVINFRMMPRVDLSQMTMGRAPEIPE